MPIKLIVYGPPGVGKTVLATSGDGTLLLNCEAGSLSVQDRIKSKKVIERVVVDFPFLEDQIHEIIEKQPRGLKTIVIDSLTEVQQKVNEWIISSTPEMGNKRPYGDGMMLGDYGYSTERMRRFVRMVRDLPYNVVFTALAQEVKNDSTGAVTTMPQMTAKLATDVCGYMDVVGYMYVENSDDGPVRKLLTQPVDSFYAKDRSGRLPMIIDLPKDKPNLDTIINLASGTKAEPKTSKE